MASEHEQAVEQQTPELTLETLQAQIRDLQVQLAKANAPKAKSEPGQPREGTKLAQLVDLLNRPEGVTNEEAKTAFGWPAISIKTMANNMGIPVRFEKVGREKRYFAVTPEAIEAERLAQIAAQEELLLETCGEPAIDLYTDDE